MWTKASLWHVCLWLPQNVAIRYRTVLKYPIVLNGTLSSFGANWLRWWSITYTRAINYILKAVSIMHPMMTSRGSASIILRFGPITWKCSRHVFLLRQIRRLPLNP